MPFRRTKLVLFFILFSFIFLPSISYAYLDPGSGSYLLQLLLAGLLAVSFTLKSVWRSLVAFVMGLFGKKDKKAGK